MNLTILTKNYQVIFLNKSSDPVLDPDISKSSDPVLDPDPLGLKVPDSTGSRSAALPCFPRTPGLRAIFAPIMSSLTRTLVLIIAWPPSQNQIFYPGTWSKRFRIPDPDPHQRIQVFLTKKLFLSSRKYDPGFSSRIRILIFYPSRIQGSKSHRVPDPDPQHCAVQCGTYFINLVIYFVVAGSGPNHAGGP